VVSNYNEILHKLTNNYHENYQIMNSLLHLVKVTLKIRVLINNKI
jgi:hypothetical protein